MIRSNGMDDSHIAIEFWGGHKCDVHFVVGRLFEGYPFGTRKAWSWLKACLENNMQNFQLAKIISSPTLLGSNVRSNSLS